MVRPTRGPRISIQWRRTPATAKLGAVARLLLVELLREERRMASGPAEEQLSLRNEGIPWNLPVMAERVGKLPASVSRALSGLEERRVVVCFASGEGRARRVRTIKLSAEAVQVAEAEARHPGETTAQHSRRLAREAREENEQRHEQRHEETHARL